MWTFLLAINVAEYVLSINYGHKLCYREKMERKVDQRTIKEFYILVLSIYKASSMQFKNNTYILISFLFLFPMKIKGFSQMDYILLIIS